MEKPNIICIDDQREVLATLKKDLNIFNESFKIIFCESAAEAIVVIEEIDAEGDHLALIICDHIMPGSNGIDFLIELNTDLRFINTKKILLTGLATHQDTITAINKGNIDYYIEKPWDSENLKTVVKTFLTQYIINSGLDYQDYLPLLDQETLFKELRIRG